ncbi:hypothetical protein JB92DRAFT_2960287 [Gautieria morchelliformis]|nr:hypothetical protein JB92DRAFT_2960287 [Gautieria morchelliformis]
MGLVVQIVSTVLAGLGLLGLSTLLLTIALVDGVVRHPIFLNFICIWTLWSVFVAFNGLAAIASPAYGQVEAGPMGQSMQDMLYVATQMATLNLVIHLWFTMKPALNGPPSSRVVMLRSLVLLVTPYLVGALPLAELFYPPGVIFGAPIRRFTAPLFLTLAIVTFLFDGALLLMCWRNRKISQRVKSEVHGSISLQLVARTLLLFTLSRVIFVAFFVVSVTSNKPDSIPAILVQISESLNPLLVFGILGVKPDTLRVWFRRSSQTHDMESNMGGTTINIENNSGSRRSHHDTVGTPAV